MTIEILPLGCHINQIEEVESYEVAKYFKKDNLSNARCFAFVSSCAQLSFDGLEIFLKTSMRVLELPKVGSLVGDRVLYSI